MDLEIEMEQLEKDGTELLNKIIEKLNNDELIKLFHYLVWKDCQDWNLAKEIVEHYQNSMTKYTMIRTYLIKHEQVNSCAHFNDCGNFKGNGVNCPSDCGIYKRSVK